MVQRLETRPENQDSLSEKSGHRMGLPCSNVRKRPNFQDALQGFPVSACPNGSDIYTSSHGQVNFRGVTVDAQVRHVL